MCFAFDALPPDLPADRLRAPLAGGAAAERSTLTSADGTEFSVAYAESPSPSGPAVLIYPDVRGLLGRTIAGRTPTTSLELADLILDEAEVAVVPGEAFGPSGYLRLSYALGDDALLEGVQRLQRLFS